MTLITFVDSDGESRVLDAENGSSLMEIAVRNAVPGIVGECGGSCACGSCHVYVAEDWLARLPGIADTEREMLELTFDTTPASRLGCQIVVTPELAGLVLTVPKPHD
jgi:2Fe-2S ferredoxin